jgi:hypothetical protein
MRPTATLLFIPTGCGALVKIGIHGGGPSSEMSKVKSRLFFPLPASTPVSHLCHVNISETECLGPGFGET